MTDSDLGGAETTDIEATGLTANELCSGVVAYPFVRGSEPAESAPCVETPLNKMKSWFNDFKEENF